MKTAEPIKKTLEDQLNETFSLLDQYTGNEINDNVGKNVILLIGVTGSGKSTLAQFLNNNENLKSVERNGAFRFVDGSKISDSTTISKTLIPELVPVNGTNFILADCPGFSDTRSASHDIAATIFTNRLLKQAENVKIAIAISHYALVEGNARSAFTNTLSHVAAFLRNIPKYEQSIGVIVTKVENLYYEDDEGNNIIVSDSVMKANIAGFMRVVKNELLSDINNSQQEKIKLIDIFLSLTSGNSSKIEIFRKPTRPGAVNKSKILQTEKLAMRKLLFEELHYTAASVKDFGLSISAESRAVVLEMARSVDQQLKLDFNTLCESVVRDFEKLTEQTSKNVDNSKRELTKFLSIHEQTQLLVLNESTFTIPDFINLLTTSDVHINDETLQSLRKQEHYLSFLQSVSEDALNITVFKEFKAFLERYERLKVIVAQKIHTFFDEQLIGDFKRLCEYVLNEFDKNKDKPLIETITKFKNFLNIRKQLKNYQTENNFSVASFIELLNKNHLQMSDDRLKSIKQQEDYLEFLKNLTKGSAVSTVPNQFRTFYTQFVSHEKSIAANINNALNTQIDVAIDVALTKFFNKCYDVIENAESFTETNFVLTKIRDFDEMVRTSQSYKSLAVLNFLEKMDKHHDYISLEDVRRDLQPQEEFNQIIRNNTDLASILLEAPDEWTRMSTLLNKFENTTTQMTLKATNKMQNFANQTMYNHLQNISSAINQRYSSIVEKSSDYADLNLILAKARTSSTNFIETIENDNTSFEDSLKQISQWLASINVVIPSLNVNLQQLKEYFLILVNVGKISSLSDYKLFLISQLTPAVQHLTSLSEWYQFITDVFGHFSQYDIQKKIDSDVISGLKNWPKLQEYLQQNNFKVSSSKSHLPSTEQESLNEVLQAVNPKNTIVTCEDSNNLLITGKLVRLSAISSAPAECQHAKHISIFSTNTVFIDVNLDYTGQKRSLYIISPVWNVIGKHRLMLDGADGAPNLTRKAKNGVAGLPGHSGTSAGNFYGVGMRFINGHDLTVTANGGHGSSGQDGGDGNDGANGVDPEAPENSGVYHWHASYGCGDLMQSKNHTFRSFKETNTEFLSDVVGENSTVAFVYNRLSFPYVLEGKTGQAGSNGAAGGAAGRGGANGELKLYEMGDPSAKSNINTSNEPGKDGAVGIGGDGGNGGRNGDYLYLTCDKYISGVWPLVFKSYDPVVINKITQGYARNGANGMNGRFKEKLNEETHIFKIQNVLEKYKFLADEEKSNKLIGPTIQQFLTTLDSHQTIVRQKRFTPLTYQHQKLETEQTSFTTTTDPHSTLFLVDFLMRKLFTKTKPVASTWNAAHLLQAQGEALNIVKACEEYLETLMQFSDCKSYEFDFPSLLKRVLDKVMQSDDIQDLESTKKWALQQVEDFYARHMCQETKKA